MLVFLGLRNFSRHHICDFAQKTQILRDLAKQSGLQNLSTLLKWSEEAEEQFTDVKILLSHAPALQIPDYTCPFHLDMAAASQTVQVCL